MSSEPADLLGLAYVIEQAIDKGSPRFDEREIADAFDAIGAAHSVHTGRQGWAFNVSCLPEFLPRAIELLAEVAVHCLFPEPAVETAVTLSRQQLLSLEDSPRGLLRRQMGLQAYGDVLGRHQLGCQETLGRISAASARELWKSVLVRSGITISLAGCFDLDATVQALDAALEAVPAGQAAQAPVEHRFAAARGHLHKPLEQTHIGISFPGVRYDEPEYTVERVLLAVLSGGMSARLFTEVREKRGLVYWVGAWHEQPRGLGMVHVGAATTPKRCGETYETLLREIARLGEDLAEDELERAKVGLIADRVTGGAAPQRRASELLVDYFHLQKLQLPDDKERALLAVSVDDVRAYLDRHPRDALSIVTLGTEQPEF